MRRTSHTPWRALRSIALLAFAFATGCEDPACSLTCDEEQGDCEDNPAAYAFLESCDPQEHACAERICQGVEDRCVSRCSEESAAGGGAR